MKWSEVIPWGGLASGYYNTMNASKGRPCKDARLVIGAMIIKHKLNLSDEETLLQIQENPYLQYFVGLSSYKGWPASTFRNGEYCTYLQDLPAMHNCWNVGAYGSGRRYQRLPRDQDPAKYLLPQEYLQGWPDYGVAPNHRIVEWPK
ncbi:MAG: transposase [Desulfobulbaceae bacterium]|nr:transposase [Desulfobulbaceae bacterium]